MDSPCELWIVIDLSGPLNVKVLPNGSFVLFKCVVNMSTVHFFASVDIWVSFVD